jgi:chromosome segregation ATPase
MAENQTEGTQQFSNSDSTETFEEKLHSLRDKWNNTILELSKKVNDISKIADVQVEIASNRQRLVEDISVMNTYLTQLKSRYKKRYQEVYNNITDPTSPDRPQVQLKTDKEKTSYINHKLSNLLYYIDIVSNQIEHYKNSLDTLDKIGFFVKNLIDVEKM